MKRSKKHIITAMLLLCCIVFAFPAQALGVLAQSASPNVEIIDDYDGRFVYSSGDANHGGWSGSQHSDPAISEHWANKPGASVEIQFHGSKFELYGKKDPQHRKFTVSIDDGESVVCDAYAAQKTDNNALLYSSQDLTLEDADHVAKVTVLDEANPAATSPLGMNVAYAKVYSMDDAEFSGYSDVDDSVTTSTHELFKIQYEGAWRSGPDSNAFDGTEHWSNTSTDSYEMTFIGTGFDIYVTTASGHGVYDVYVDGEKQGEINAKTDNRQNKVLGISVKDLEETEHTLRVVGHEGSGTVHLDMIRVFHNELAPTKLTLSRNEVTLIPGGTTKLEVMAEPWVATETSLIWESSDPDVIAVDQEGVLTAKDISTKQTATITVTSASNPEVSAQAVVTVDPNRAFMNAFIGNEKLLDLSADYNTLKDESRSHFQATAWKGDELNSKVIVTSKDSALENITITASDFTSSRGATIPQEDISINWLKEVKANIGRANGNAPVKDFPEMIHAGGPKDLSPQSAAFAWIQIQVDRNTAPGTYYGTLYVTADGLQTPFELQYEIEVLNLMQPELESTDLQIWQHPFAVANYYLGLGANPQNGISNEVAKDFYFTDAHFNLMRASMEEYVSAGGHDAVANIVEEAWGHQSYYNDLSMVQWTKNVDGSWSFDYTWYDAWINFMIECGVLDPEQGIGQIKCYSIVPWNNQIAYYDAASQKVVTERHAPGSDGWKALWKPFLEDFLKHSIEKGWFDITYISMDERSLNDLTQAVDMIESVQDSEGRSFKISSALNYVSSEHFAFTDRIDDISINLDHIGSVEQMKNLTAHRKEQGLTTTLYNCTGNYPNSFTISDPGDSYWTIWYTMTLGTDGYLRWAWDNYVYNMHENITYRYWEPGDGWFVYPEERESVDVEAGESADIYTTPRYEMLKQGMRDVAKAKYLLSCGQLSDEQEQQLRDVVEHLKQPNAGTSYGSKVPASEADRMLVHSETQRALDMTNQIAREIAPTIPSVDKSELKELLETARNLEETDYTTASWADFESALAFATSVFEDASATQDSVNHAVEQLRSAMDHLDPIPVEPTENPQPTPSPEETAPTPEPPPATGDASHLLLWSLFGFVALTGLLSIFGLSRKKR